MPNESQNKSPLWKIRLEVLDDSPEETFNKAAAWEKLYTRLYVKSSDRRIRWYWAAATCLLLTFLIIWLSETKKEIPLAKHPIQQKHSIPTTVSPAPASQPMEIYKRDSAKVITFLYFPKKPGKSFIAKANKKILPASDNTTIDTFSAKNNDTHETRLNNIAPPNTSPVTGVKVQARQKFRVIHINELSQPVEEVKFARNEENIFPIKISNKDIFSGSSGSNNSGHNILKINLSPQN